MNKKGQSINQIAGAIFGIIVLATFLSILPSLVNPPCPACDCSQYQNALSNCQTNLSLIQKDIQDRPVIYVNQTIEVPVNNTVDKIIYNNTENNPLSVTIISISLILSFVITLFSFKIKLPRRLEEELEEIENIIKFFKIGSLILTILIFIKLLIILFF